MAYPELEELAIEERLVCQICEERRAFKMYKYLLRHLEKDHSVTKSEMKDSWVLKEFNKERAIERKPKVVLAMSGPERAAVGLAYTEYGFVDEESYTCKWCNMVLKKVSFFGHIKRAHDFSREDAKDWYIVKDATMLKNTTSEAFREKHLVFTKAIEAAAQQGGGEDQNEADEEGGGEEPEVADAAAAVQAPGAEANAGNAPGAAADAAPAPAGSGSDCMEEDSMELVEQRAEGNLAAPSYMKPKPKQFPRRAQAVAGSPRPQAQQEESQSQDSSSFLEKTLGDLAKAVTALSEKSSSPRKDDEVQVLDISLTEEMKAWTGDGIPADSRRKQWPIRKEVTMELGGFKAFLESRGLANDSLEKHLQGARYFFSLLELPEEGVSLVGVMVSIYKKNLAQEMFTQKLMDKKNSWTRKIVDAAALVCEHLVVECGRRREEEAARCIRQLNAESFDSKKKLLGKERKLSGFKRKQRDAELLERLPPVSVMKEVVKTAMIDLHWIQQHACKEERMEASLRRAANAAMIAIIHYNGYAGRSMDWEMLKRSSVEGALDQGLDYIRVDEYKTFKTYGELGKYLAPGTKEAVKRYMELPVSGRDIFLEPASERQAKVSVAVLLRRVGSAYHPKYYAPRVNLLRKWFHTGVKTDNEKAMKFIARLDGHSEGVANQVYCASCPEKDAKSAKVLVEVMLGGALEWPTEEELATGSLESVRRRFAKVTQGKSEDELDREEEEEPEEDDDDSADSPGEDLEESAHVEKSQRKQAPAPLGKQQAIHVYFPQRKQRGRTMLTEEQKEWTVKECRAFTGEGEWMPPTHWFETLRSKGIEEGVLTKDNTSEALRSYMRGRMQKKRIQDAIAGNKSKKVKKDQRIKKGEKKTKEAKASRKYGAVKKLKKDKKKDGGGSKALRQQPGGSASSALVDGQDID